MKQNALRARMRKRPSRTCAREDVCADFHRAKPASLEPKVSNLRTAHKNPLHLHFPSENLLIIFIVFLEQLRCIKLIRTFLHALVAMETSFDLLHIFLPGLVKPSLGRCTADHEGHAGTVVDQDPCRTWHAVSAAAAEITG